MMSNWRAQLPPQAQLLWALSDEGSALVNPKPVLPLERDMIERYDLPCRLSEPQRVPPPQQKPNQDRPNEGNTVRGMKVMPRQASLIQVSAPHRDLLLIQKVSGAVRERGPPVLGESTKLFL